MNTVRCTVYTTTSYYYNMLLQLKANKCIWKVSEYFLEAGSFHGLQLIFAGVLPLAPPPAALPMCSQVS